MVVFVSLKKSNKIEFSDKRSDTHAIFIAVQIVFAEFTIKKRKI